MITNLGGSVTTTPVALNVTKAAASVALSNLTQTFTGSALSAKVTTVPAGLTTVVTYNNSTTAPTAALSASSVTTEVMSRSMS